jgi:hypothetical protein
VEKRQPWSGDDTHLARLRTLARKLSAEGRAGDADACLLAADDIVDLRRMIGDGERRRP